MGREDRMSVTRQQRCSDEARARMTLYPTSTRVEVTKLGRAPSRAERASTGRPTVNLAPVGRPQTFNERSAAWSPGFWGAW